MTREWAADATEAAETHSQPAILLHTLIRFRSAKLNIGRVIGIRGEFTRSTWRYTTQNLPVVVDNFGWKAQDGVNLALLVEALLKTDMLYHTIRHRLSKDVCPPRAICWNLPLPYRPHTELQYGDVSRLDT